MAGDIADTPLEQLLAGRYSVRGFRADPVPEPLIRHIFAAAQRAPSNCNAQPWLAHVVSGQAAKRLRNALFAAATSGAVPDPDVPISHTGYQGVYRERQINSAKALFAATGVTREDTGGRAASMQRNFRFFDAPHAAFIFMPAAFGMREAIDVGMYAQTLMLLFAAHGIDCCAQGALSHFAGTVHRELRVGGDQLLMFGIAFGFADLEHPANATRTERAPLSEAAVFHTDILPIVEEFAP